jgi:hypothetical protein
MKIARGREIFGNFRCPYQAQVMKRLEAHNRSMGAIRGEVKNICMTGAFF